MKPTIDRLPVLVEESVWPEFQPAVRSIGEGWASPAGRAYELELENRRLVVSLLLVGYELPSAAEIDDDLFELACQLQDLVGEPWSADALREMVELWSRAGNPSPEPGA